MSILAQALKDHFSKKGPAHDISLLFEKEMIMDLNEESSFRNLFVVIPSVWGNDFISDDQLTRFQAKLVDVLNKHVSPSIHDECAPTNETLEISVNTDLSLRDIAKYLRKGQVERFVLDNFKPLALSTYHDMTTNISEYMDGSVSKWISRLLLKAVNKDKVALKLAEGAMVFKWTDDGLPTNKQTDIYMSRQAILAKRAEKDKIETPPPSMMSM